MMKKIWYLAGLAVFLGGCATTANYKKAVNSWLGVDITVLAESWGYPSETFTAPNGNLVYVYANSDTYQAPRYTSYTYNPQTNSGYAYEYGGETLKYYCKTFFETGADKKIIKATFEGNACKSKPK